MRAVGVKSYSAAVWKFRLTSSRFLPRLAVSHGGGEADRVAQPPPWRFQDFRSDQNITAVCMTVTAVQGTRQVMRYPTSPTLATKKQDSRERSGCLTPATLRRGGGHGIPPGTKDAQRVRLEFFVYHQATRQAAVTLDPRRSPCRGVTNLSLNSTLMRRSHLRRFLPGQGRIPSNSLNPNSSCSWRRSRFGSGTSSSWNHSNATVWSHCLR
jgi:hypothetical protein